MELEDLGRSLTDQNNNLADLMMDILSAVKKQGDQVNKSVHPGSSADTAELDKAMAEAQKTIQTAHKNKDNPFHKSKYSDLASCWDACREALSVNGLSVKQFVEPTKDFYVIRLVTKLSHSSGQWESGVMEGRCQERTLKFGEDGKVVKNSFDKDVTVWEDSASPQTYGTVLTYLRRYGLCAMVGIAPSDTDAESGENGSTGGSGKKYDETPIKPAVSKPDSGKSNEKEKSGASGSKTETKPPASSHGSTGASSSGLSEANQKKLEDSMEKNEFSDSERADLLAVYDAKTLADIPKDKFIKATRTISEIIKMR